MIMKEVIMEEMINKEKLKNRLISTLSDDWRDALKSYLDGEEFDNICNILSMRILDDKEIFYPKLDNIFRAFKLTPLSDVKVVILGQDPYHTPNTADGLAFSTSREAYMPPSLRNIFKELDDDLNIKNNSTDLSPWAKEGILLLNASLTVIEGKANSDEAMWKGFSDKVIDVLNKDTRPKVFVLWGNFAQKKAGLVSKPHIIIKSAHPSPLSANRGFFGSHVFSKINEALRYFNYDEIDFKLR